MSDVIDIVASGDDIVQVNVTDTPDVITVEISDKQETVDIFVSDIGLKGEKGDTGATGPAGPKGDTGAQGMQGIQGVQGPKGDTGPAGEKGDTGAQGPQGLKGDKGDTGPAGADGKDGVSWEAATFNTTLDFGNNQRLVTATIADATMTATKIIQCFYTDKLDEVAILNMRVSERNRTVGVSFEIVGCAPDGASGIYPVRIITSGA